MVESRKIIKFGVSSYVVTIPYDWMRKNNLKKGKELNLSRTENSLVLSVKRDFEEKRAKINIDKKPLKLFNRELISNYLKNYKYIEIVGTDIFDKIDKIKVFQEKLSSVEIVEINENKIVMKDLTSPEELNFNNILNEIIEMSKMLFNQVIKEEKKENFAKKHFFISQLDSNINKLTFLAYKSINYNLDTILDPDKVKNSIHYWRIISALENIGDIVKRIARYMRNASEEDIFHINNIFKQVGNYFDFVSSLINPNIKLENNLALSLDKKQSLLREIETLKDNLKTNLNLYLVISQLFKDILGQLDQVILSITDLN